MKAFSEATGQKNLLLASDNRDINPIVELIRQEVSRRIAPGKPVIIGVILVESLCEADTGPRPSEQMTLTPALDL